MCICNAGFDLKMYLIMTYLFDIVHFRFHICRGFICCPPVVLCTFAVCNTLCSLCFLSSLCCQLSAGDIKSPPKIRQSTIKQNLLGAFFFWFFDTTIHSTNSPVNVKRVRDRPTVYPRCLLLCVRACGE